MCNVPCTIKSHTKSKLLTSMLKHYKIYKENKAKESNNLINYNYKNVQNLKSISGTVVLASFSPGQKFLKQSLQEHNADHLLHLDFITNKLKKPVRDSE